jgi:hypothetical protein
MSQQGDRKRQHGWLRGTFRLRLLSTLVNRISDGAAVCNNNCIEVSIDFKRPLSIDSQAEIAWRMHKEKKRHAEIAEALGGCSKSYVTKLLKYHAKKHNLEWIDGRSLRSEFPHQNRQPALSKRIVDQVMELYFKDVPLGEIAVICGVDRTTVRKAIRWYYEQRDKRVPDGRTRAGRTKRNRNRDQDAA